MYNINFRYSNGEKQTDCYAEYKDAKHYFEIAKDKKNILKMTLKDGKTILDRYERPEEFIINGIKVYDWNYDYENEEYIFIDNKYNTIACISETEKHFNKLLKKSKSENDMWNKLVELFGE